MNDKELAEFVDLLYPYFVKKLKSDSSFKNCIKSTNATVTWVDTSQDSNIGKNVKIKFPYDSEEITVVNKSTSELAVGNLVCIHYYIDLKNAYVAYKV